MFGKTSKPTTKIDSLIGSGTMIEGDVVFSGGLRIDGEVRGNVSATEGQQGTLVLSENARIEGGVTVPHVVVNGTVNGPIRSSAFLELQPRARIAGDVEYSSIEMHLGAIVQGKLVHRGETTAAAVELKLASSH